MMITQTCTETKEDRFQILKYYIIHYNSLYRSVLKKTSMTFLNVDLVGLC